MESFELFTSVFSFTQCIEELVLLLQFTLLSIFIYLFISIYYIHSHPGELIYFNTLIVLYLDFKCHRWMLFVYCYPTKLEYILNSDSRQWYWYECRSAG